MKVEKKNVRIEKRKMKYASRFGQDLSRYKKMKNLLAVPVFDPKKSPPVWNGMKIAGNHNPSMGIKGRNINIVDLFLIKI